MMSLDDQFEMARLPIKPLAYENRDVAQCNEFMIDYGEDKSYHLYIVHHTDDTKYIDLTNVIATEITETGTAISGDNITIKIEGIQDPQSLGELLNIIWKNYLFPDDDSGFDVTRDLYKLYLDSTTSILLTDSDGTIYLPVTTADNVYDANGNSIQSRLDSITKFAWSIDYVYATTDNQTSFEFTYPFPDYDDLLEVRIGTTYVDQTRYIVTESYDTDNHIIGGTITFLDESVEMGRRVDLIFMYNVNADGTGSTINYISGNSIANGTITISKLAKTSDSYTLNDSSSLATSAAVYNLYQEMTNMIMDKDHVGFYFDLSDSSTTIDIGEIDVDLDECSYYFFYIVTNCAKDATTSLTYTYNSVSKTYTYLYDLNGNQNTNTIKSGQLIKVLWHNSQNVVYLLNNGELTLNATRFSYRAQDAETTISFSGLEYDYNNSIINVYRNSLRLFEDIDYYMDKPNETITLYVRTEETELIVFEALTAYNS